jgi:hypothetical protein
MRRVRALSWLAAIVATACSGPPPRRGADSPSADPPSGARKERFSYLRGCGWMSQGGPRVARAVVDLRLRSGHRNRTPSDDDVRAVERVGGRVLHRFNVALLRAELDTAGIRALVEAPNGIAAMASSVSDSLDLTAEVQVFYTRPITAEDRQAVERLGARRLGSPIPRRVLYAEVPDSAIPALSRQPGVDFVRARAMVCGRFLGSTSLTGGHELLKLIAVCGQSLPSHSI